MEPGSVFSLHEYSIMRSKWFETHREFARLSYTQSFLRASGTGLDAAKHERWQHRKAEGDEAAMSLMKLKDRNFGAKTTFWFGSDIVHYPFSIT